MRRLGASAVFLASTVVLVAGIAPAGRVPTGDAPRLLGRAAAFADLLRDGALVEAGVRWWTQVEPHPPLGYVPAVAAALPGAWEGAALAVSVAALAVLFGACVRLLGAVPWRAWLLFVATPMTWTAVEHVHWDLLAAAAVAWAVALWAAPGRGAGVALGAAGLVKYSSAFFLWLPVALGATKSPRKAARAVAVAVVVVGVWLLGIAPELGDYLGRSATAGDSASASLTLAERLQPSAWGYYPLVARLALGWPGLLFLGFAIRARGTAAAAAWAALGGMLALTLVTGRREPRYLLPALPLLLVAAEDGVRRVGPWPRQLVTAFLLAGGLLQLGLSARTSLTWEDPQPLAPLELEQRLLWWGAWPRPEPVFQPVSARPDAVRLDELLERVAVELGPGPATVGWLHADHPDLPGAPLVQGQARRAGYAWTVARISARMGEGRADLQVEVVPFEDLDRRFEVLLAVPRPQDVVVAPLLAELGPPVERIRLPLGLDAMILRVPEGFWEGELGQELLAAPAATPGR